MGPVPGVDRLGVWRIKTERGDRSSSEQLVFTTRSEWTVWANHQKCPNWIPKLFFVKFSPQKIQTDRPAGANWAIVGPLGCRMKKFWGAYIILSGSFPTSECSVSADDKSDSLTPRQLSGLGCGSHAPLACPFCERSASFSLAEPCL